MASIHVRCLIEFPGLVGVIRTVPIPVFFLAQRPKAKQGQVVNAQAFTELLIR